MTNGRTRFNYTFKDEIQIGRRALQAPALEGRDDRAERREGHDRGERAERREGDDRGERAERATTEEREQTGERATINTVRTTSPQIKLPAAHAPARRGRASRIARWYRGRET